ncbi:hypothetical protein LSAT2_025836 [Lamellibrachia satsuma]|nr:hypothetical protein LSAT2_025836 [Lamellibrachia satsuma]
MHGRVGVTSKNMPCSRQPVVLFGASTNRSVLRGALKPRAGTQCCVSYKDSEGALHMVCQAVSPRSPITCARTYFFLNGSLPHPVRDRGRDLGRKTMGDGGRDLGGVRDSRRDLGRKTVRDGEKLGKGAVRDGGRDLGSGAVKDGEGDLGSGAVRDGGRDLGRKTMGDGERDLGGVRDSGRDLGRE